VLADPPGLGGLGRDRPVRKVLGSSVEKRVMTLLTVIASCLAAFGLGYAGGSAIRIARKAIESID